MATWGHYGTIADHNDYWASHGEPAAWSGADVTDAQKTAALVTATEYLDATYGRYWQGRRAVSTQTLDWPRTSVYDADGYSVASTSTPQAIKDVVSILALKVREGTDLLPDVAAGTIGSGSVTGKTEKVGPIMESTEYTEGSARVSSAPMFAKVTRLLYASGLIKSGGRAVRG